MPLLPALSSKLFAEEASEQKAKVALVKTQDRRQGVKTVLNALYYAPMEGRQILIKPNFNTADPTPGSTHNDTLAQLITEIRSRGGENITIGESSGPPATKNVMEQKGIFQMAEELEVNIINYEELADDQWIHFNPEGIHWPNGFSIPRVAAESEYFVSTCCLKTHGFGGVFTMSLKLAVGLTPKSIRGELHSFSSTHMRRMIAELNLGYKPDLIVLDGIEVFTNGGPSRGTLKRGDVFIGSTDRIAVDVVGLAVLKDLGSNVNIMNRNIFEQEQIERAVELGLGISAPDQIEFVTPDDESRIYAEKLTEILAKESDVNVERNNKQPFIEILNIHPNPFNLSTTIEYSLTQDSQVTLNIYNVSGQIINVLKDEYKQAGNYSAIWDASGMPSGIYFCTMKSGEFIQTKKILLLK